MQDLSPYQAAAFLADGMKTGPQFVRVTRGARSGTVGIVKQVRMKFYSAHEYQISCKGKRPFWLDGATLEYLPTYSGETKYIRNGEFKVDHADMLGRPLGVGQTVVFSRNGDMVLGTIKRISNTASGSALYAKLFKQARSEESMRGLVRIGVPQCAMIVDNGTMTEIMLAKMSMQ